LPQAPDKVRVKGFTVSNNPQIKLNPPQRKHIIFGGVIVHFHGRASAARLDDHGHEDAQSFTTRGTGKAW
jgi:hypothetical protein